MLQCVSTFFSSLRILEVGPAKRAAWTIAALKPFEQTNTMEQILTGCTLLIWQLPVGTDNTVTDCTLALPFERSIHVSLEGCQRIDEGAVKDGNGTQGRS